MDTVTRKQAKELGLQKYYTGKPCKNGHTCERVVSCGNCVECSAAAFQKWYKANAELYRELRRTQYKANPELHRERQRKRHRDNPERHRAQRRQQRQNNPEPHRQRTRKWQRNNPELSREASRNWARNNPDRRREYDAARRAREQNACPIWVDRSELAKIYANCPPGYHVDHEVPLNHPLVCGLHVPANLKAIPADENLTKGNKFDPESYIHLFPDSITKPS